MSTDNIMSSKVYCGARKTPKGRESGTEEECKKKGQLRLYGVNKIEQKEEPKKKAPPKKPKAEPKKPKAEPKKPKAEPKKPKAEPKKKAPPKPKKPTLDEMRETAKLYKKDIETFVDKYDGKPLKKLLNEAETKEEKRKIIKQIEKEKMKIMKMIDRSHLSILPEKERESMKKNTKDFQRFTNILKKNYDVLLKQGLKIPPIKK